MKDFERRLLCQGAMVSLLTGVAFFFMWFAPISAGEEIPIPTTSLQRGAQAKPGYVYSFPHDHGSHDQCGLEWWYFTGHLLNESGRQFGYELTFFRKAIDDPRVQNSSSRWAIKQLYFAHLALTDVENQTFRFAEKLSRAGLGKAGAKSDQMEVWIDRWSLNPVTSDHQVLSLKASEETFGLDLKLTVEKSPVIHGEEGISRKGAEAGQASHYYSLTRLATEGQLSLGSEQFEVTGLSWMDHEFGSGELGDDQVGWDWFSLQFDSKVELMVYLLRRKDGSSDPVSSGTLIFPDGRSQHLRLQNIDVETQDYWTSPHTKARYPAKWVINVPSAQLRVQVNPVLADQELRTSKSTQVPYWEGAVDVSGEHRGAPIQGQGYVELTGYTRPLNMGRE
jgi:predicted secreted hydrolase